MYRSVGNGIRAFFCTETRLVYDLLKILKESFPAVIKEIKLVSITTEIKLDFFPEI